MKTTSLCLLLGSWGVVTTAQAFSCFGREYRSLDTNIQFGEPIDQRNLGLCSSFALANILSAATGRVGEKLQNISPWALAVHAYLGDPVRRSTLCQEYNPNGFDPFSKGNAITAIDKHFQSKQECMLVADTLDARNIFNDLNAYFSQSLTMKALEDLRKTGIPSQIEDIKKELAKTSETEINYRKELEAELKRYQRKLMFVEIIMQLRSGSCPREELLSQQLLDEFKKENGVVKLPKLELYNPTDAIRRACAKGDTAAASHFLREALCLGLPVLTGLQTSEALSFRSMGRKDYAEWLKGKVNFESFQETRYTLGMKHDTVISGMVETSQGTQILIWDSNVGLSRYRGKEGHLLFSNIKDLCKFNDFRVVASPEEMKALGADVKTKEAFHLKRVEGKKVLHVTGVSPSSGDVPQGHE